MPAKIHVLRDGEQAIRYFEQIDIGALPCPALVLLDINLPKKPGTAVLTRIRTSRRCAEMAVVVVSTSQSPRDQQNMMQLGATSYFQKPSEYGAFMKLGELVKEILFRTP